MRSGPMRLCLLAFLALTMRAASEEVPAKGGPCRADAERYCASVGMEKGARSRCLREHLAELSPTCRERIDSGRRHGADSKRIGPLEDCAADLHAHCPNEQRHGAQVRCLRAHRDELSAECSERVSGKRKPKQPQSES
jgi:hypothetical protein